MSTKRWIDLTEHNMYLGSITGADRVERLCLVDVDNKADPAALRGIGFLPFEGSPRFDKGIYYLSGNQALKPSALAAALGLPKCPVIEVDAQEIEAVFRRVVEAKFEANINAVALNAPVLGVNRTGQYVFGGAAGRFIRMTENEIVLENSQAGHALGHTAFLHAKEPGDVAACAEGFIQPMLRGSKADWTDVVAFAKVLHGRDATDIELHELQEGIEAAAYRAFSAGHSEANEESFKAATQTYYNLPAARMRTSESVLLHQLSTPLPMAVIAQRLLVGKDDLAGKTVLEPTVGNGSLVNLLPDDAKVYGLELDAKRVRAASGMPGLNVTQGDATTIPLRAQFAQPDGFDYTISNPPFGGLEGVHTFDKLKNIRRMDYFIGLRTLGARKDEGRSVLIFGADTKYSVGAVEKSAKAFLNYVYDHYEVHGCTEIDGRLYGRQGSAYNVRMIVIGDKLATPREAVVPQSLPVLNTYEELWSWSDNVLASYSQPEAHVTVALPDPVVDEETAATSDDVQVVEVPGYTRLANGTLVANRAIWLPDMSVRDMEDRIRKEQGDSEDVERLKDYKWMLLFDHQSAYEKDFMDSYIADGGPVLVMRRKFWLTDIEDRIKEFGGDPQDLTNNELVLAEGGRVVPEAAPTADVGEVLSTTLDADELSIAITESAVLDVPEGWLVMNAPRPLVGTRVEDNGKFLAGVHYAAIDPSDTAAPMYLEENRKLAASMVMVISRQEQIAMALAGSRYRRAYYEDMNAEERFASLAAPLAKLNELSYGEAKVKLAAARVDIAQYEEAKRTKANVEEIVVAPPVGEAGEDVESAKASRKPQMVAKDDPQIDIGTLDELAEPGFVTEENRPAVVVAKPKGPVVQRKVNEYQTPYQPASELGQPSSMIPINMAGATYAALNALQARFGSIDDYVADKLQYSKDELGVYFSPEQVDALALGINALDSGRGMIEADETGLGKGRFVAGMMRYAKLQGKRPHFITIKPELFTDIFRDINDIGSGDLFKKLFIFNTGVNVMKFGTADTVLYKGTNAREMQAVVERGELDDDVDMVLGTYSQFQKAAHKNAKARLLTAISDRKAVLFMDESHVASGASNISATMGEAVANSSGVIYASATPLKGVSNFNIYNKVFPASVNLKDLPDTLRAGGEALQEAISANMARDGVLIRREHDFSKLTFVTRMPDDAVQASNRAMADQLSRILSVMSYMSGDVAKVVGSLNKSYEKAWEEIPAKDRQGGRMRASSMNFGSRLYAINRQFLMGIKIDESIQTALEDLQEGRKPVFAVENTGESLLRQVLARRAGVGDMERELDDLDERMGSLTEAELIRREQLVEQINASLRNVRLDSAPQFRELLEIMVERIGQIKVTGRYGDVSTKLPESESYAESVKRVLAMIKELPDLPLTPLDVIRAGMSKRGFPITEVSGRTSSLAYEDGVWTPQFHPKFDAVASVAGFQNGKYDCIIITRSGSTGISLHATNRFADSDTRQRNFIVIQKAANIAEFLQWLGRVNRKDQIIPPIITMIESGLPAELRQTMMHNAKLRKLSANTTSNRENSNTTGEDFDLLNEVGDEVALRWLFENPDVARSLDIALPKDDDESRFTQDCPFINKLLGRLMMVEVETQEHILNAVSRRFADRVAELEQRGENPFKVDVFDWGAKVVGVEELQSGVLHPTDSTFDEAVKLVSLEYEQDVKPIRGDRLVSMIKQGVKAYTEHGPLDESGTLMKYKKGLRSLSEDALRRQLPMKLQEQSGAVADIIAANKDDTTLAKKAMEKQEFLFSNLEMFRPGAFVIYDDIFKGQQVGFVTAVDFPRERDELFLLSKYTMRVVSAGAEDYKEVSLATLFNQGRDLRASSHKSIDPEKAARQAYLKTRMDRELEPYDAAPDGKITRRAHVLQGNLFRACELASQQRIGAPVLFSDAEGNRQRAVLLRSYISPEEVKTMPIGLDAREIADYIEEFLRPDHKNHRQRATFGGLAIYDVGYKEMKQGEGIMFEVLNGGQQFRFSMPGAKSRTGGLMVDGHIFDIGEAHTPENSLKLSLSGTARTAMTVDVSREVMPELLRRLQKGGYVGKFYLPTPDHETLKALKTKYAHESARDLSDEHDHSF